MSIRQPIKHLGSTLVLFLVLVQWTLSSNAGARSIDVRGVAVVPHRQSTEMRYRREPDLSLGAWVQLFLVNNGSSPLGLNPQTPVRLSPPAAWRVSPMLA